MDTKFLIKNICPYWIKTWFIISLGLTLICCEKNKEKVGYVFNQKLFTDFQGTKEMSNQFTSVQQRQKYILDSLALEINTLDSIKAKQEVIDKQKQLYNKLLSQFQESNGKQEQQYTEGLWKQINQYVKQYGEENGYSFIYGANGTGSLMFADSTYDVTKDVLQYINKKYAGK